MDAREIKDVKRRFAHLIAENNKREQEALMGYYELIDMLKSYEGWKMIFGELVEDIDELISDELNHSATLQGWAIKLGGVKEAKD